MARSVYGQLNQANIGQGIDTLLREIFEGDPQKYATEASAIDSITSTASSEAEFEKLDKVSIAEDSVAYFSLSPSNISRRRVSIPCPILA